MAQLTFCICEVRKYRPQAFEVHSTTVCQWDAYLGADASTRGIHLKTSSFARPPASAGLTRAKVAALYATSILAKTEATDEGFDEALLLDSHGFVAEASGENVFIVKRGKLIEPEPSAALLGITRDSVIELARDRGLSVTSRRVTRDDIYAADEAFLTGTAAELVPVVTLDRRTVGTGCPGPITLLLQQAYSDAVHGRDSKRREWLTNVA